jgi:hypothetical protein
MAFFFRAVQRDLTTPFSARSSSRVFTRSPPARLVLLGERDLQELAAGERLIGVSPFITAAAARPSGCVPSTASKCSSGSAVASRRRCS